MTQMKPPPENPGCFRSPSDGGSPAFDGELVMIDSSSIRVHQHGATLKRGDSNRCMGCSRGGLTTKIHALVDGRGLSIQLHLFAGQASDCTQADPLLSAVPEGSAFLANKVYDSDATRTQITKRGGFANIPAKRNRRQGSPSARSSTAIGT